MHLYISVPLMLTFACIEGKYSRWGGTAGWQRGAVDVDKHASSAAQRNGPPHEPSAAGSPETALLLVLIHDPTVADLCH